MVWKRLKNWLWLALKACRGRPCPFRLAKHSLVLLFPLFSSGPRKTVSCRIQGMFCFICLCTYLHITWINIILETLFLVTKNNSISGLVGWSISPSVCLSNCPFVHPFVGQWVRCFSKTAYSKKFNKSA